MCSSFPFGFDGGMFVLITEYCLSIYLTSFCQFVDSTSRAYSCIRFPVILSETMFRGSVIFTLLPSKIIMDNHTLRILPLYENGIADAK